MCYSSLSLSHTYIRFVSVSPTPFWFVEIHKGYFQIKHALWLVIQSWDGCALAKQW